MSCSAAEYFFLFVCLSFVIGYVKLVFFLHNTILDAAITKARRFFRLSIYCASKFSGKLKTSCCRSRRAASAPKSCFINPTINGLPLLLWTGNVASSKHFLDSRTIFSRVVVACSHVAECGCGACWEECSVMSLARDSDSVLLIIDKWSPFELHLCARLSSRIDSI